MSDVNKKIMRYVVHLLSIYFNQKLTIIRRSTSGKKYSICYFYTPKQNRIVPCRHLASSLECPELNEIFWICLATSSYLSLVQKSNEDNV